ncbi:zinc-binding alcohol dehydrogenase family protein [Pseudomonas sp. P8_241]|jgi:NADPH:quinone reductase-like Zn-dependent oxidoreductase|uniref:quinone oxidoreductase family protein n=1 Tax=Pseudomonas sp. P8_241 TaxID=3043445 RepID=UPI002A3649BE|nr:zinc-binding alcohol dehydrogenase family protein [Pseudomonas sp. P8_241]WPN44554.1 zinc-binding alcohol dehydrogenase family protein [Pseudomonas sp. P8_241]
MKAAVVHDFNAPPRYDNFSTPVAEADETLVQVRAAALSQLVKAQASGRHYSSGKTLPLVPGVDGVGLLPDGRRVYFAFPRKLFGSMAETSVVPLDNCVEIPDGVDDVTAAAIGNPGMSSWAALLDRARFVPGENVLINGATGVSGRLAIQIAKHLGAAKVIATGRNAHSVQGLTALGADLVIPLDAPAEELKANFHDAFHKHKVNVVLDYLWGPSAESLLHAAVGQDHQAGEPRIRFVQIGSLTGNNINLPGSLLRSSGLELMGSGLGSVSHAGLVEAVGGVLRAINSAGLSIAAEAVPLAEVESAWQREGTSRLVFTL